MHGKTSAVKPKDLTRLLVAWRTDSSSSTTEIGNLDRATPSPRQSESSTAIEAYPLSVRKAGLYVRKGGPYEGLELCSRDSHSRSHSYQLR
jgi:hypothetical protein